MTEGIIIAIITGGMAILSNIIVAWAQNSKTVYRIEQLEKKMEKHNQFSDRLVVLEENTKAQWKRIDEMRDILTSREERETK